MQWPSGMGGKECFQVVQSCEEKCHRKEWCREREKAKINSTWVRECVGRRDVEMDKIAFTDGAVWRSFSQRSLS